MIAKLCGIVDTIYDDGIIIDINGIGYFVFLSQKTLNKLEKNQEVSFYISHIFRQDVQFLCGFFDNEEKSIFDALLDVPGIGVKSAMSILSVLTPCEVAFAVANGDSSVICRANGIGKKSAERIVVELKDRNIVKAGEIKDISTENVNDAILGLMSLGYPKKQIEEVLRKLNGVIGPEFSSNDIIKIVLKEF